MPLPFVSAGSARSFWPVSNLAGTAMSAPAVPLLPETQALITRFTTPPTYGRAVLINSLIGSLIAAGVWSKLDTLYVMAAADAQAAQQNWLQNAYNLTPANAPTFVADRGYAGNGTTSYLDTGWAPGTNGVNYALNNASLGVWNRTERVANGMALMGATTASGASVFPMFTGDLCFTRITDGGGSVPTTGSSGFIIGVRTAAGSRTTYRNGSSLGVVAVASGSLNAVSFFICGQSAGGVLNASSASTDQASAAFTGGTLSAGEVTSFYVAMLAYLQGVGAA